MNSRNPLYWLSFILATFPASAFAHEMWVLSAEVVEEWAQKPLPQAYTTLTLASVIVVAAALFINTVLFSLHRRGANEMFPVFRARMRTMRPYTAVVLRVCLSWVLLSSAMAMEPRFGNAVWSQPTLLAPDILISELPASWHWLRWFEVLIGLTLLVGIYVRAAALACLLLVGLALYLSGIAAVSYAPVYTGVALYLLYSGGSSHYIALPAPSRIKTLTNKLIENASLSRAQFFLRVLAGCNFLFLAIYFKVLQPNLMLAIIDVHDLPIMGLNPEVFVLIITAVEISIGLLVIFGILLRFLSVVLIGAFLFFAICLSDAETLTSHMLYYGVAISFLFNGNGQWRQRTAVDTKAHILILGNSLGSVAAAQQLERLLPSATNVKVSVLTHRSDVQFTAMLPEVVSGSVQPTTLSNPLSRIVSSARLILGEVQSINTAEQRVIYSGPGGTQHTIEYDELIVANEPELDRSFESYVQAARIGHLGSIADALQLKQQILSSLIGRAEQTTRQSSQPLRVAILGGGERGSALAMEIHSLLDILKTDRCIDRATDVQVFVLERVQERADMSKPILSLRSKHFKKRGIRSVDAVKVKSLCDDSVILSDGKKMSMDIVINLQTIEVLPEFSDIKADPSALRRADLAFSGAPHIWLASHGKTLRMNVQRRISMQLAQAKQAAFNAWASSQSLPTKDTGGVSPCPAPSRGC